jgi:alkylhydroperoxidase family enzyme
MAHLPVTGLRDAKGPLRDAYDLLGQRRLPPVYVPAHGDAPGIIRAHSLDPTAMRCAFQVSGSLNGQGPLEWPERELVNAVTSRLNQCFY